MSVPEALRGAKVQLAQTSSWSGKLRLIASYARIITGELVGTVFLIPYGWRSLRLHQTLPKLRQPSHASPNSGVYLCRDVRYGPNARNTLDIYVPANAWNSCHDAARLPAGDCTPESMPVAFFCHGGVWATGEKWQYAPLATHLAQEGILTCVLQYSLYPQALVPQMVREVSSALTWTLDHAASYGGRPSAVSMVGHSAGAQLCMMALLHRAASKLQQKHAPADGGNGTFVDKRMPAQFVGMAGAYDIATHYEYEKGRGVEFLSTMARAIGGFSKFASQSPAVILRRSANACELAAEEKFSTNLDATSDAQLQGRLAAADVGVSGQGILGSALSTAESHKVPKAALATSAESQEESCHHILELTSAELQSLPPSFLLSSRADITVPWTQSEEMYKQLRRCGNRVQSSTYEGVNHADFVIDWRPKDAGSPQAATAMPAFARDLVELLKSP